MYVHAYIYIQHLLSPYNRISHYFQDARLIRTYSWYQVLFYVHTNIWIHLVQDSGGLSPMAWYVDVCFPWCFVFFCWFVCLFWCLWWNISAHCRKAFPWLDLHHTVSVGLFPKSRHPTNHQKSRVPIKKGPLQISQFWLVVSTPLKKY